MLSIVTAAKGRLEQTRKAFNSIWENAENPANIEHYIVVDCQDHALKKLVSEYGNFYKSVGINIVATEVCHCNIPNGYENRNIHKEYWNPLAKSCSGDLVFGMPNDCIIETKGFDKIMLESFEQAKAKYNHDCFQVLIDDDCSRDSARPTGIKKLAEESSWSKGKLEFSQENIESNTEKEFCSWVILSRSAVNAIQGICADEYQFDSADRHIYDVFANTPIPAQIDLRDRVKTQHVSHWTGRAEIDEVHMSKPLKSEKCYTELAVIERLKPYHYRVNYEIIRQVFDIDKEIYSL